MAVQIEDYFNTLKPVINAHGVEEYRPTVTELALHLGFESRQSFYEYEVKPRFTYILRQAHALVQIVHEKKVFDPNCTGSIFMLKNMGYDKGDAQITNNIELDLSKMPVIQKLLKYIPSENIQQAMEELEKEEEKNV
jgi:hypothetical protein